MVGGRDAAGRDQTNDLSYLCLEALRRTRLIYPTVGVCWHQDTPPALTDLAIDIIADGISTPAFFGDATIQRGLKGLGVPVDEACDFINSTCVEITPSASSNVWVASPYFSTCQILLDEIKAQAGAQTARTFSEFLACYGARLRDHVNRGAAEQNVLRQTRFDHGGKPLQSVFTRDCIERGRDIDDGGARYNWVECSFVGLANLTDSLHVIRKEVFEAKAMDFGELNRLLASDFAGEERIHSRFLFTHEKYGQGNEAIDALFGELVTFVVAECAGHKMLPNGAHCVPGAFS
jgi:formate C-acetyltransferase